MKKLFLGDSVVHLFMQVLPISLIVGFFYFLFRIFYLKRKKISISYKKEWFRFFFVCYLTGLINLVLVPVNFWSRIWYFVFYEVLDFPFSGMFSFSIHLIPIFFEIVTGKMVFGRWVLTMLIGNFLMFLPMGFFLAFSLKKQKNIFLYAFFIPFCIELLQPIVGRSVDIDDLLLNFMGILLGFCFTHGIFKMINIIKNFKKK